MQISRPMAQPLTELELQELEQFTALVQRAIQDGLLSADEMATIKARMNSDGKVSFEELQICQRLIWDKIQRGEVSHSW